MEIERNKRTLFSFAGKYKYFTIISCILSGISSLIGLVPYLYIWLIIRKVFQTFPAVSNAQGIENYALLAVKYSVLSILIYFFALLFSHLAAFRIARNMKSEILHHVSDLSFEFFNNIGTGKLRRVIDESTGETETFLAHQLPDFCSSLMTPLGIVIFLFYFDWRFGVLSICPLIIGLYFLNNMMNSKKLSKNLEKYQTSLEKMNNEAVEYIRGIPIVKTFQQTIYSFKNFYSSIMEYKKFVVEYTIKTRKSAVLFFTFINGIFLFLIPGGIILINQSKDFKEILLNLIFYILITPICAVTFLKIMFAGEAIMLAFDAKKRILKILDNEVQKEGKEKILDGNIALEIKNLSFKYPGNKNLSLKKLCLRVRKLEKIGIVGFSGSGKSTIVNLLARFWDDYEGEIKIFGKNIKEISQEELMKNISFLFQNNNLFKGTILDNIKIGNLKASKEEVLEACKKAMCEDIINKFKNGLDTVLGNEGVEISGGERQRIALARIILKNSPILILDEATAFIDPENEYYIQKVLKEISKEKTVIIIAHKLSTVVDADRIFLIEDGKIVEEGSHIKLLNKKLKYFKMWEEYKTSINWKIKKEDC